MRRVLVVDDSEAFRQVFIRLLRKIEPSLALDEACDGGEAIRLFARGHYDFVFLDIDMPEVDGWIALEEIRKRDPNAQVFMVSASSREIAEPRAMEMGATGFLSKPIDYSEFLALLRTQCVATPCRTP